MGIGLTIAQTTPVFVLVDLGLVSFLIWRIKPNRFRQLKWHTAVASAIFWSIFGAALLWGFWEAYYSYFYPAWVRWAVAPLAAVIYSLTGLIFWWLAVHLPGHPVATFCLLGGLEALPEHLWGIYGLRILEVPILQGLTTPSVLVFAFFEYILYWSVVLGIAALLQVGWERRRGTRTVPG